MQEMQEITGPVYEAKSTVLVFRNILLPHSETFIKDQVKAIRRWRPVLVGLRSVHELPLDDVDYRLLMSNNGNLLGRIRWEISKTGGWLRSSIERLKREEPSLLHIHFGVDAVQLWPLTKELKLPTLVTLHGYDITIEKEWWEAGHAGTRMRSYPSRLLQLAGERMVRFVAISEAIRRRAIEFGIPEQKISLCHIGVDTAAFSPGGKRINQRELRVLFVGRLVEKKGCEYLIRAFSQVQSRVPDASLVIVGDGPLRDKLQDLARHLGIRSFFQGTRSKKDVQRELERARVLCLPSVRARNGDSEGFGMVLLEAQASGVPVVSSAIGGATEGIDEGVTGFAFGERDVDTLAARLIHLLVDEKTATMFSAAGPSFVSRKFDLDKCTMRLESVYDLTSSIR